MLTDREIDQAAAQLAKYRNEDELSRILDQYAVLIEKYKRLKSDNAIPSFWSSSTAMVTCSRTRC
jgi:hypothetical protein